MLITALANTNCFKVVERVALEEIKEELELMGVKPQATLKTADFIITGAVTALELKASGLGGGGFIVPLPFGLGAKLGKSSAHIGLDMRIIRVKTGEVLAAKAVEGKSEKWAFGLAAGGLFGTTVGGAYFNAIKNTPLEEATRDLIVRAVALIIESVKPLAPTNVQIGEKQVYYNEKGEIIKEEIKGLDKNAKPSPQRVDSSNAPSGGLMREGITFEPYKNLLWRENFANCKLIPTTVKIVKGQGECVTFEGKKWFATTKGEVIFEKAISQFKPSKDWALEGEVYFSPTQGYEYDHKISLFIGKLGSPISLHLTKAVESWKWGGYPEGTPIPNEAGLPRDLSGQKIKIALKKEGEIIHIFVNGVRSLSVPVDVPALSGLSPKVVVRLEGVDLGKGLYTLISELKLTAK